MTLASSTRLLASSTRLRLLSGRLGQPAAPALRRLLSTRPTSARSVLKPLPEKGDWISDAPGLLGPTMRKQLNERMTELDDSGRGQMAIVILRNIGDGKSIGGLSAYGRFTEEIFDLWGIGRRGINDGVLLAVFLEGRRIEVRTGAGARKVLPDMWLQDMQEREMVPLFRAGERAGAVERGAHLILDELEGLSPLVAHEVEGGKLARTTERAVAGSGSDPVERTRDLAAFGKGRALTKGMSRDAAALLGEFDSVKRRINHVLFALIGVFFCLTIYWEWAAERKKRRCHVCPAELMVIMDVVPSALDGNSDLASKAASFQRAAAAAAARAESAEGEEKAAAVQAQQVAQAQASAALRWLKGPEALSPCQLDERRVESVTFELLRCPRCGGERMLRRPNALRSWQWSECSSCKCYTAEEKREKVKEPTVTQPGEMLHTVKCHHCGGEHCFTSTIHKASSGSSSGGGGGGGGFGGGSSSGGGGGGSSWLVAPDEDWLDSPPSVLVRRAVTRGRAALGWDEEA